MAKTLMPTDGVSLAAEANRTWNTVEVDPITLRVIGGALNSMAKEMAQVLYRMAYSSLIRESEDLAPASSTSTVANCASRIRLRCTVVRSRPTSAASTASSPEPTSRVT